MTALDIKHCGGCKSVKPLTEFGTINGRPRSRCKPCMREQRRTEYRALEKNPVDPHLFVAYLDRHRNDGVQGRESA